MSETTNFAVSARVREYNTARGFRTDGELTDALNTKIEEMLNGAHQRARENGRTTVRPHDL